MLNVVQVLAFLSVIGVPIALAVERLVKRETVQIVDAVGAATLSYLAAFTVNVVTSHYQDSAVAQAIGGATPMQVQLAFGVAVVTVLGFGRSQYRTLFSTAAALGGLAVVLLGQDSVTGVLLSALLGRIVATAWLSVRGVLDTRPGIARILTELTHDGFRAHPGSVRVLEPGTDGARRFRVTASTTARVAAKSALPAATTSAPPTTPNQTLDLAVLDQSQRAADLASAPLAVDPPARPGPPPQLLLPAPHRRERSPDGHGRRGRRHPHPAPALGPPGRPGHRRCSPTTTSTPRASPTSPTAPGPPRCTVASGPCGSTCAAASSRTANSPSTTSGWIPPAELWLTDVGYGEITAEDLLCRLDGAELLVSLALRVGPARATEEAVDALGPATVASLLPLMQPILFSEDTAKALRRHRATGDRADVVGAIRDRIVALHPEADVQPVSLERVRPRTRPERGRRRRRLLPAGHPAHRLPDTQAR